MSRLRSISFAFALLLFVAAFAGAVVKQPLLLSAISSNSMVPILQRGDLVFSLPTLVRDPRLGDIVVFRQGAGPWIAHRIVGGDADRGFYTKGDANPTRDQDTPGFARVTTAEIVAVVPTLGGQPLKMPLLGNANLYLQESGGQPFFMGVAAVLLILMLLDPARGGRRLAKMPKEDDALPVVILLLAGGFAVVTVAKSVIFPLEYEVIAEPERTFVSTAMNRIVVHERVEHPITLSNSGFLFPLVFSLTSNLPDFSSDCDWTVLWPGESRQVILRFGTESTGVYTGEVRVGAYLPVLPPALLHHLGLVNPWLAVALVSVVPSLPLLVIWLVGKRGARRRHGHRRPVHSEQLSELMVGQ